MKITKYMFVLIVLLTSMSAANVNAKRPVKEPQPVTDCNWVGVNVKDCVVFDGAGDLSANFKGPGMYAVKYLNTPDWGYNYTYYAATSYAFGSTSITVSDVNGNDMTDALRITYNTYGTITGIPVGHYSNDLTLIYEVRGISLSTKVVFRNACTWTGWC
jgi:hypothetical protein